MNEYRKVSLEIANSYFLQGLSILIGLIIIPLLTRKLSTAEYGFYSLLMTTINVITSFVGLGIGNFIIRDLTGKEKKYQSEKKNIILSFAILNCIIYLILFIIFQIFNYQNQWIDIKLVSFIFGIIISYYITNLTIYILKSNLKIIPSNILAFISGDLWLTIPIIYIAIFKQINVIKLIEFKFELSILLLSAVIYYNLKEFKFNFNKKYYYDALRYGTPFLLLTISQIILTSSDRYFLKYYSGNESIAYYSLIYSIMGIISLLGQQIISILSNYSIREKNKDNINSLININVKSLKYSLIVVIPLTTLMLVMGSEIITMISGPKYLLALNIIPIIIFYPIFRNINVCYQNILALEKKTLELGKIYLLGMITNLALNSILIPKLNIIGASISTVISYFVIMLLLSKKIKKYNHEYLLDYKKFQVKEILISSTIIGIILYQFDPNTAITKISLIFAGFIGYIILLLITKVISNYEFEIIKKIYQKN